MGEGELELRIQTSEIEREVEGLTGIKDRNGITIDKGVQKKRSWDMSKRDEAVFWRNVSKP